MCPARVQWNRNNWLLAAEPNGLRKWEGKMLRRTTLVSALLLLFWFTLDLTGCSIGGVILVVSAFIDEPIDALFWLIYATCIVLFIAKNKVGRFCLAAWTALWGFFQIGKYFMSSPDHIAGYNHFFAEEGTYYLLSPSDVYLIKDLYHMVIDILIVLTFVLSLVYLLQSLQKENRRRKDPDAQ
jgi:hypothetical protein